MKAALSASKKARRAGQRGARSKHSAAKAQQEANQVIEELIGKSTHSHRPPKRTAPEDIPPYCYRLPGMSAEEGAATAVKDLRIAHACDALSILWELRREALEAASVAGESQPIRHDNKSNHGVSTHVSTSPIQKP